MSVTSSRHPEIVWAQRSDKVFLTVELPDAKNPEVKIDPEGKFIFSASAGIHVYEVVLELFGKVNPETSTITVGPRHIFSVIQKDEKKWWSRLLKSEGKPPPYVKVDWNKWVDEDEESETSNFNDFNLGGMDDYDTSKFELGGADADSDDEEIPESEPESISQPENTHEKSA
ncbi:hypothetical protein O6H91_23G068400 [Diphasiastrum complanatum]|uniref:Uncharacterized protein n=1 Tax=Diphasiastrum complanatum TaxID=34168 RepID=A0ACC2AD32_DIPCM|nr:hypothetical protein O6H91_23G068400 [Diphasiastrum complanatum]